MTNELWPVGTWVADTKNGDVFRVIDPIDGQTILEKILNGFVAGLRRIDSKDGFTELPPLPDEEALKAQGYRLTGMAADCSKSGHGHIWARAGSVFSPHEMCSFTYDGWRWLVERIETDLDASEQRIQEGLEKLRQGRTTIIIAHRLSTIERADKIAVMAKGHITDVGSHAYLLEHSKLYASLYRFQVDRRAEEAAAAGAS